LGLDQPSPRQRNKTTTLAYTHHTSAPVENIKNSARLSKNMRKDNV
jgi:hypothetical protein